MENKDSFDNLLQYDVSKELSSTFLNQYGDMTIESYLKARVEAQIMHIKKQAIQSCQEIRDKAIQGKKDLLL